MSTSKEPVESMKNSEVTIMLEYDENETDDEDPWSENMKVDLLKMVMTGKIKRKDYISSIKERE